MGHHLYDFIMLCQTYISWNSRNSKHGIPGIPRYPGISNLLRYPGISKDTLCDTFNTQTEHGHSTCRPHEKPSEQANRDPPAETRAGMQRHEQRPPAETKIVHRAGHEGDQRQPGWRRWQRYGRRPHVDGGEGGGEGGSEGGGEGGGERGGERGGTGGGERLPVLVLCQPALVARFSCPLRVSACRLPASVVRFNGPLRLSAFRPGCPLWLPALASRSTLAPVRGPLNT